MKNKNLKLKCRNQNKDYCYCRDCWLLIVVVVIVVRGRINYDHLVCKLLIAERTDPSPPALLGDFSDWKEQLTSSKPRRNLSFKKDRNFNSCRLTFELTVTRRAFRKRQIDEHVNRMLAGAPITINLQFILHDGQKLRPGKRGSIEFVFLCSVTLKIEFSRENLA